MSESRRDTRFPILRSIIQAETLEETLRSVYGIPVTHCELLKPNLSDIYRVDSTAGPYILRIYPHSNNLARWILAELEILRELKEAGVPVSTAVQSARGELLLPLQSAEGARYAVLFEYAHGHSLKRTKDPQHWRAFGRLAAAMHNAAPRLLTGAARPSLDAYTLLARPLELLGALYGARDADFEVLREAAERAGAVMEFLSTNGPAWGFCHGDLNFSNARVTATGELTLLNFEYCGSGWPVYDIATVMNFETVDAARIFLDGYESERPLQPRERAAIGWFQIANKLWMLGTAAGLSDIYGSQMISGRMFDDTLEFVEEKMAVLGR